MAPVMHQRDSGEDRRPPQRLSGADMQSDGEAWGRGVQPGQERRGEPQESWKQQ